MTASTSKSSTLHSVRDIIFFLTALAILISAVPVSALAGVPDLTGAAMLTLGWLIMGSATLLAMKRSGAFQHYAES